MVRRDPILGVYARSQITQRELSYSDANLCVKLGVSFRAGNMIGRLELFDRVIINYGMERGDNTPIISADNRSCNVIDAWFNQNMCMR